MKKLLLGLVFLSNFLFATDVAVCKFKGGSLSGFVDDKIVCSGAFEKSSTIQELYADNWEYKGSYTVREETYMLFEKEISSQNN